MFGYGHDWTMMGGWGGGAFGMIIWPLVLIALVVGVIWYFRSLSYAGAGRLELPRHSSGLDILNERFARGDIDRDEYLQKKKDISG